MLRVIREVAPRYIVGENVLGLVNWNGGLVFDEVQADLEAEGYQVATVVIPAAAKNAPHGRDRVWFVAYSNSRGRCGEKGFGQHDLRRSQSQEQDNNFEQTNKGLEQRNENWNATNSDSNGQHERNGCDEVHASQGGEYALGDIGAGDDDGFTADADFKRFKQHKVATLSNKKERFNNKENFGSGYKCWQNFPTQSPVCTRNDGLSAGLDAITFSKWRNESIKAAGNAIVPQVAFEIFKVIQTIETQS